METLDTALGYAERGWPVLAISPNSKVPIKDDLLQSNGALSASTDPEHIQKLFTQYPKANLAIATGQSSVVVVDLDGIEAVKALEDAGLTIPTNCYLVRTPRGFHFYLDGKAHQELKQTAGLLEKVDIRNDGGYVLAPPSTITTDGETKEYTLENDAPVGHWPELVAFANAKPSLNGTSGVRRASAEAWDDTQQPDWFSTYLSDGAPEGQRNDICARMAGYLHLKHMPEQIAIQLLEPFRNACTPPMDMHELERTVRSIYRYERTNTSSTQDVGEIICDSSIANRRVFRYTDIDLIVELTHILQHRQAISCWIKFKTSSEKIYGPKSLNLLSASACKSLRSELNECDPTVNWQSVIDEICENVADSLIESSEAVDIRTVEPEVEDTSWLVRPFIKNYQPNTLMGIGGSGKSTLAIAICLSVSTGVPFLPGISVNVTGATLFCDWEDDQNEFGGVVDGLLKPRGMTRNDLKHPIIYRSFAGPFTSHIESIQTDVAKNDIVLVCVDSLVGSSSTDINDAESARTFYQAVATLGISSLGITHLPKGGDGKTPIGSVMWRERSRNLFLVEKDQSDGAPTSLIALSHVKGNRTGGLMKPFGFDARFVTNEQGKATSIEYSPGDLSVSAILSHRLPPIDLIMPLLRIRQSNIPDLAKEIPELSIKDIQTALDSAVRQGKVTKSKTGLYSVDSYIDTSNSFSYPP